MVGLLMDAASGYGRDILKGVLRYANTERRWLIHEQFRHLTDAPLTNFPRCDGAIVAGVSAAVLESVLRRSKHVIHCSGTGDPSRMHVVSVDDRAVGKLAAEHLLDCRLQHFGFVGFDESRLARARMDGFRETLRQRGFDCIEAEVGWPGTNSLVEHAHWPKLIEWLKLLPKPAGILAIDDNAAHDVAAACHYAGISVPDRIAIIGINNDDLLCDSAWPPLSSVQCDYFHVGRAAAEMLDRLLSGKVLAPDERVIRLSPPGVVRRASTEILAVDDPKLAEAVRYIREHACTPCSVVDVIKHAKVGRRWLERQFVKKLGRNPHDEILRVRIDTSRKLLLQTELTLPEIASRCGFAANQNFGRAFLHVTGITPGLYRRKMARGVK